MSENTQSTLIDEGTISFQAEGRLLQELGLRLVASPEVALVEIIKNAYDADANVCDVSLYESRDETQLIVKDDGHGMTMDDFANKWMRIATSSKLGREASRKYKRKLTGAKGIGRFAVRYLGNELMLESVAYDKKHKSRTRITAIFDWPELDKIAQLSDVGVQYQLEKVGRDMALGTTLTISELRADASFVQSRTLRDDVLRMVSPIQGLERGRFSKKKDTSANDPGFRVELPDDDSSSDHVDLASLVLDNAWARLIIDLRKHSLKYTVTFGSDSKRKPYKLNIQHSNNISNGLYADIRFFPRRGGIFSGKGIHGQKAWKWVRSNHGVAIVDNGFRIKPYGFADDDWLNLDTDATRNLRDWRTDIANKYFPVPATKKPFPGANPVLNLATNFQLIGAVFIQTVRPSDAGADTDLVPSMDREGLLGTPGSEQLYEIVRAGIEFLANEDKAELERAAAKKARETARNARTDIQAAIKHITDSDTLTPGDKARIVKQYKNLADQVDEQEKYSAQARRSLLTMSLLGVLAGFMTHESKAAVHDLEYAAKKVRELSKKQKVLVGTADDLEARLTSFQGYLAYTKLFIEKAGTSDAKPMSAAGQVRHVVKRFDSFCKQRGIKVKVDIASDIMTPAIPVTVYSGAVLNVYTNALKAVMSASNSLEEPRIIFRSWNERKAHHLEVSDNGPGVPPAMRKRIWEPLFTTTSDLGNPLGSGMGLGLTLVRQVLSEFGGKLSLVEQPPPDFSTCFRITLPAKQR